MNIHQAVEHVEEHQNFKEFITENPHYYLAHGFCVIEKEQSSWQVGYYSKKLDKIVVFTADEKVTKAPEEEAFKKDGHVEQLDLEQVSTNLDKILEACTKVHKKNHSAENIIKTIVIIQTLKGEPTWNITMITHAFNMINVRIHARSSEVLRTNTTSILNLGKRT